MRMIMIVIVTVMMMSLLMNKGLYFFIILLLSMKLIKSYMKNHEILDAHKNKIDVLNVEKSNLVEKIRFLEFEHHSLLEKNNALT